MFVFPIFTLLSFCEVASPGGFREGRGWRGRDDANGQRRSVRLKLVESSMRSGMVHRDTSLAGCGMEYRSKELEEPSLRSTCSQTDQHNRLLGHTPRRSRMRQRAVTFSRPKNFSPSGKESPRLRSTEDCPPINAQGPPNSTECSTENEAKSGKSGGMFQLMVVKIEIRLKWSITKSIACFSK